MKNIGRLISLLWTYPGSTIGGLVAIICSDIVQLSIPRITKTIVDRLEAQQMVRQELLAWGAFILILAVISYLSKQIWRHLILGAARKVEFELREKLLNKTLSLTMQRAKETENGKFMALASNDIPAVGQALAFGVVAFFDSIFITLVAFVMMYRLSPTLTGYAFVPFPVLGLLMVLSLRRIYKKWDAAQQTLEDLTEKTRESLSGIRTLRAYAQSLGDIDSFQVRNLEYRGKILDYVKIDATFSPLILLFAGSSSGILLYFGGSLVIENQITVGTMAAFIGYLGLLTWPMIAAGWMLVLLQRGSASIKRLDEILDTESEPEDRPELPPASHLELKNLTFAYPDGTVSVKDWSVSLPAGKTLGIVGPVGSGKSTVMRLLQLLEDPPKEAIFLDGEDVTQYSPPSVRRNFSYVSQEPFLFSDTIANNLRMARPEASENDMKQVVELAALSADLEAFPEGLETMLGERGISLSGGQRQRTALARALLKSSPILLLDDTLSAVDTVTEGRILEHLKIEQSERRQSTIIISHRLSAVMHADEILVVENGHIVDRGTHRQLSRRSGLYRELLNHQSNEEQDHFV